jgi:hypothetical protein
MKEKLVIRDKHPWSSTLPKSMHFVYFFKKFVYFFHFFGPKILCPNESETLSSSGTGHRKNNDFTTMMDPAIFVPFLAHKLSAVFSVLGFCFLLRHGRRNLKTPIP